MFTKSTAKSLNVILYTSMDLLYMFKDSDMIVLSDNGMIRKRDTSHALKYLDGSNWCGFCGGAFVVPGSIPLTSSSL